MGIHVDASELNRFAVDLTSAGENVIEPARKILRQDARKLRNSWRQRARHSAGRHGKHYPRAITDEVLSNVALIGPESGLPQGGMSFEFGSRNQPPHLDGSRALDKWGPIFVKHMTELADDVVEDLT